MPEEETSGNAAQIEFWNSEAARAWGEQHARMDLALAELTQSLLAFAAPQPGEHVLDIGCGGGTTVLELAARVGAGGCVLGVDVARPSAARARSRIAAAGLTQAEVIAADASTHPFRAAGFDLAFSRLGVMFFSDPVAAFANVRRALKPGGRLSLGVFRADSPFPSAATAAARHLLPPSPAAAPEEPGPFSWADPGRVHRILEGAGFREVSLTATDPMIHLAGPGGAVEAADFAMTFGPITRVLAGLAAADRDAVRTTLEAFFRAQDGPQGVALPARNWVVQARC